MQKIAIWSDYDWCWLECLEDYLVFKSDDYKVVSIPADIPEPTFEFIKGVADGF